MGVIFATFHIKGTLPEFHIKGTLPEVREKLNRSLRGKEMSLASSFNTRLLIASGPVALPNCRDFNMVLTSKGEVERKLRLCSGRVISGGKVAFNVVLKLKCSLHVQIFTHV